MNELRAEEDVASLNCLTIFSFNAGGISFGQLFRISSSFCSCSIRPCCASASLILCFSRFRMYTVSLYFNFLLLSFSLRTIPYRSRTLMSYLVLNRFCICIRMDVWVCIVLSTVLDTSLIMLLQPGAALPAQLPCEMCPIKLSVKSSFSPWGGTP